MNKIPKMLIILSLLMSLTACWDKVEINDRAFVSAIGVDEYTEENIEKEHVGVKEANFSSRNRLIVTYVFPNLGAIGKNATSQDPRFLVSTVAPNLHEATEQLTTRMNQVLFFKHVKAIIIGEDTAKNEEYIREIFDSLERHDQVSRKAYILIAKGTAKDVTELQDKLQPETGTLISQIFRNKQGGTRYNQQTLEEIILSFHRNKSALIPRIIAGDGELKIGGSAIIKNYKLIGWLGELENRAVMFMLDKVSSEVITIENKGITIPFIITDSKTKKTAKVADGSLTVDISIEMEGFIQQYTLDPPQNLMDAEIIKAIENKVEEQLKKEIYETINKMQKEFKIDIFGIADYLSKFKPSYWEQVKNDWEEVFPNIDIGVTIDAKVRRTGMTK